MNFLTDPQGIEARSMEIIREGLKHSWTEDELTVVERLIHTSGDTSLEEDIIIHPQAIAAGISVLQGGGRVVCDVEMVRTGINKRLLSSFGGRADCFLNEPGVAAQAKEWRLTRTMSAIRLHAHELKNSIVAVGNAPTALFEVLRLAADPETRPALIVGIPVGFVGAAEAKALLVEHQGLPSITVRGTRGGSPLAAAAINALLINAVRKKGLA